MYKIYLISNLKRYFIKKITISVYNNRVQGAMFPTAGFVTRRALDCLSDGKRLGNETAQMGDN